MTTLCTDQFYTTDRMVTMTRSLKPRLWKRSAKQEGVPDIELRRH